MTGWGRRSDNGKSYPKTGPKGVAGAGTKTSATGDVHMKSPRVCSKCGASLLGRNQCSACGYNHGGPKNPELETDVGGKYSDKYDHDIFLAIRSMVARYGGMSLGEFINISGYEGDEAEEAFDELVNLGFLKQTSKGDDPHYRSIESKESPRVKRIAASEETPYFNELESF